MENEITTLEWDEEKSQKCLVERGFDFSVFYGFDFANAKTIIDDRFNYGETRYRAYGEIDGLLYAVVFIIKGNAIRIISGRRAHKKEFRKYV